MARTKGTIPQPFNNSSPGESWFDRSDITMLVVLDPTLGSILDSSYCDNGVRKDSSLLLSFVTTTPGCLEP